MFNALKSLYPSVNSCVRDNIFLTDWFDVNCGLRQDCSLSPILFNLFINDLASSVKSLNKGIDLGTGDKSCILLYAYDVALISDSEDDLQLMLSLLDRRCTNNQMSVNPAKSQIVHFRPRSASRSNF